MRAGMFFGGGAGDGMCEVEPISAAALRILLGFIGQGLVGGSTLLSAKIICSIPSLVLAV